MTHQPCTSAAGLVAAAPLFGGPRSDSKANRALFRTVLAATDALTMAWLLSQYAFQVYMLCSVEIALYSCCLQCGTGNSSACSTAMPQLPRLCNAA
jgi:hypothetical protein